MISEVLPIGTIIKIKNSDYRLLIVGHEYEEQDVIYDYACVSHSLGITNKDMKSNNNIILINSDDIEEVNSLGYVDQNIYNRLLYIKTIRTMRKEKRNEE